MIERLICCFVGAPTNDVVYTPTKVWSAVSYKSSAMSVGTKFNLDFISPNKALQPTVLPSLRCGKTVG